MFGWLKNRRRARLLAEPFPVDWAEHFRRNVPYAAFLSPDQVSRLKDNLRIFIAEKEWVGCGGLEVTDEMRVTIAALACLLVLEIPPTYYYERVKSVLIYRGAYQWRQSRLQQSGIFHQPVLLGEAWPRSPIVLSWQAVLEGVADPHDGNNVVFHEFAHHLDDIDEGVDGTPPLESREQYRTWDEVVDREYRRLVKASREGKPTLLDYYGATDHAEFFAVATECFFECGAQLREEHAELYEVLRGFYRQDTAAWPRGTPQEAPRRRVGWRQAPRVRSDNDGPVDIHPSATAENAQIERLLETVRIQPGTASAHFSLGVLYLNRRDFHKASDAFSAAIALEPQDGESWRHRGLARIGLGDFAAARSDLDKAISLDPHDSDGYRARAEAQVELGNFEEALADCTVAVRANGHDAGALHIKGMALAGLKQYKSAITSLNSAINADPNRAEFYADRSRILEALGDRRRAERDRIEAIRLDPDLTR